MNFREGIRNWLGKEPVRENGTIRETLSSYARNIMGRCENFSELVNQRFGLKKGMDHDARDFLNIALSESFFYTNYRVRNMEGDIKVLLPENVFTEIATNFADQKRGRCEELLNRLRTTDPVTQSMVYAFPLMAEADKAVDFISRMLSCYGQDKIPPVRISQLAHLTGELSDAMEEIKNFAQRKEAYRHLQSF